MKHYILDEEHNLVEVTLLEWAAWLEVPGAKRVAEDYVDDTWISTVFLGIDHGYDINGPRLWFETMVFPNCKEDDYRDSYCERYTTWDEAVAGHTRIVMQEQNKVVNINERSLRS